MLGQLFQRSDDLLDYNIRNEEGKAILGDLKSGYLNSFGAFVSRGRKKEQIDLLVRSQNMQDFYEAMGGEKLFKEAVEQFDRLNSELIDVYQHHLKTLSQMLAPNELGLIEEIRPLTDILYWRKKPS